MMNIERCRACLNTNAPEYIDMETKLSCGKICYLEFFKQCTQLDIHLDDMLLPRLLCNSCSNDLAAFYMFVQTALQAHATLQGELESKVVIMAEDHDDSVSHELLQYGDEGNILLECVVLHDDNDNEDEEQLEQEEMLVMEEEQHLLDLSASEIEYTTKCAPKIEPPSPPTNDIDYYATDELDDEYLIEYNDNEQLINNNKCIKVELNTDFDMNDGINGSKWRCIVCKRILRGDVSYVGHMNMHRNRRPYACDQCRCSFRCKYALERHKLARHANVKKLENNTHLTTDLNTTICSYCSREFVSAAVVDEHVQLLHGADASCLCPYCVIPTTLQRSEIPQHLQQEHDTQYCLHYGQEYNDVFDDNNDVSIKQICTVECPICKKQLQQKNLDKHLLLHKNKANQKDNKFLCAYCPREFKNQKSLAQHERAHAGESADVVFICGECNRHYATQFLLDAHRKQAHKERDNICNICGNAFKLKNQLSNHMKLHLEKNIKCQHCDKRYARPFDLNVHMRSHTGELPFSCHLCDRRFAIKVRLTYHLQKHYGTKHPCRECGAEFNSKQKLKAHSYKHTGMPYRCELCNNRGFANRDVFKRHLLRVHNTTMTDDELVAMFQHNTGKTTRIREVQKFINNNNEPIGATAIKHIKDNDIYNL